MHDNHDYQEHGLLPSRLPPTEGPTWQRQACPGSIPNKSQHGVQIPNRSRGACVIGQGNRRDELTIRWKANDELSVSARVCVNELVDGMR